MIAPALRRMRSNLSVFARGLILVGVPLAISIIIICSLYLVISQTDQEVKKGQELEKSEELSVICLMTVYHMGWDAARILRDGATEQAVAETKDLSQSNQLLKSEMRVKEEFPAMVSHDLRSPLTAVLGVAKLIAAGAFGPLSPLPDEMDKEGSGCLSDSQA